MRVNRHHRPQKRDMKKSSSQGHKDPFISRPDVTAGGEVTENSCNASAFILTHSSGPSDKVAFNNTPHLP